MKHDILVDFIFGKNQLWWFLRHVGSLLYRDIYVKLKFKGVKFKIYPQEIYAILPRK